MAESTGFLLLIPVLALSIWLVNYSGDVGLASAQMSAAVQKGADAAAVVLTQPPERISAAALNAAAKQRAVSVVTTAAIGICDTASPEFNVDVSLVKLTEPDTEHVLAEHVLVVKATCPLLGASPRDSAGSTRNNPGYNNEVNNDASNAVTATAISSPFKSSFSSPPIDIAPNSALGSALSQTDS